MIEQERNDRTFYDPMVWKLLGGAAKGGGIAGGLLGVLFAWMAIIWAHAWSDFSLDYGDPVKPPTFAWMLRISVLAVFGGSVLGAVVLCHVTAFFVTALALWKRKHERHGWKLQVAKVLVSLYLLVIFLFITAKLSISFR